MQERDTGYIWLDGDWQLEDFSDITKSYVQLYSFAYSICPDFVGDGKKDVFGSLYQIYPWRGGYSTVHFYNEIFKRIPKEFRPEIVRIQYASPGFIELALYVAAAGAVARIVKSICASIREVHSVYADIQKNSVQYKLSKINLAREELHLEEQRVKFCDSASIKLAQLIGLSEQEVDILEKRTNGNKVMKLKILMSVIRRSEIIAEKKSKKMIDL